jgi:hypothetical protein
LILGSLDQLVENLRKSLSNPDDLKTAFVPIIDQLLSVLHPGRSPPPALTDSQLQVALRKGISPYEYMSCEERLKERQLPPKEAFSSKLTGHVLSDEDYKKACEAWKEFGCGTLSDYTRVYVALDVLLLASVFERFRSTCLDARIGYGLDPVHFLTAPSLSWAAMLFHNHQKGIEIENMVDYNMLLMVEKGIRGGMCQVFHPFANANFEGMNPGNDVSLPQYNPAEPESRILYLDANNLYGWAMSQPLPLGDYVWEKEKNDTTTMMEEEEEEKEKEKEEESEVFPPPRKKAHVDIEACWLIKSQDMWSCSDMELVTKYILERLNPDGEYGWIFELDLEYPQELHDLHNDYPLCPERKRVTPSSFSIQQAEKLGLHLLYRKGSNVGHEKLVLDLTPKREYVIHYRNLQQCLRLGLRLTKIHRVIRFRQSAWLKSYIDMNTERRKQAKDAVAKDFFKLMNNAIFGKTMEQVRNRREVEFFVGEKSINEALKVIASPYIKAQRIIANDAILALEKRKLKVRMNRPMILGMTILDLSKLHMFNFHYDVMLPHFGPSHAKLCYTDTDSLVYLLKAPQGSTVYDVLREIQEKEDCFDLSEIQDQNHPLLEGQDKMKNARVLGKFKDELFGVPLIQFIALRPKMYSMVSLNNKEKSRHKGIPKTVTLLHHDYLKAFYQGKGENVSFQRIDHNKCFELQTVEHTKQGLHACDDKSYYEDAFTSYRYGHYRIAQQK